MIFALLVCKWLFFQLFTQISSSRSRFFWADTHSAPQLFNVCVNPGILLDEAAINQLMQCRDHILKSPKPQILSFQKVLGLLSFSVDICFYTSFQNVFCLSACVYFYSDKCSDWFTPKFFSLMFVLLFLFLFGLHSAYL